MPHGVHPLIVHLIDNGNAASLDWSGENYLGKDELSCRERIFKLLLLFFLMDCWLQFVFVVAIKKMILEFLVFLLKIQMVCHVAGEISTPGGCK